MQTAAQVAISFVVASAFLVGAFLSGAYVGDQAKGTTTTVTIERVVNRTIEVQVPASIILEAPLRDLESLSFNLTITMPGGDAWSGLGSPTIRASYSHPDGDLGRVFQSIILRPISLSGVDLCDGSVLRYDSWFVTTTGVEETPNQSSITYQAETAGFPFTGLLLPGDGCGARIASASSWNVTFTAELDGILGPVVTAPDGSIIIDEWDITREFTHSA